MLLWMAYVLRSPSFEQKWRLWRTVSCSHSQNWKQSINDVETVARFNQLGETVHKWNMHVDYLDNQSWRNNIRIDELAETQDELGTDQNFMSKPFQWLDQVGPASWSHILGLADFKEWRVHYVCDNESNNDIQHHRYQNISLSRCKVKCNVKSLHN